MFTRFAQALLLSAALFVTHPLVASDALEEIIVTAGFRDFALMKSAGSISVIGEQLIHDRAARHFDETLSVLPNVNFSAGGTRARFIQIRGLGDLEQFVDPKHFPSVGITIDEVEVGTTATGAILMDVDQIELLRGPQGTEFGANALAGMINIRTQEPAASPGGYLSSGYANFDTWHVGAGVSGPLSESLRGRLTMQQNKSDGYYRNAFLGKDDNNKRDELAVRGKLQWSGRRGAKIRLSAAYADIDGGYDAFSLDNVRATLSDNPGHDQQESIALAVKASWPVLDGASWETLLSWREHDEDYAFDEDWVFAGFCDGRRCQPALEFSATDQLALKKDVLALDMRLKSEQAAPGWVVGLYAQRRDEDLQRQRFVVFSSQYESERYAVYGQLQVEPADNWRVTAGLRYEHYADKYRDSNALITASSERYWSGQLSLEYRHSHHTFLYARLARGVKPGGVNTEASSDFPVIAKAEQERLEREAENTKASADPPLMRPSFQPFLLSRQQFETETLFNKEIGLKGRYLDDALTLRLTLFHMERGNAQLESFLWDANTFIFTGFLDSSSDAENYGAEMEIAGQLSERVGLFANGAYLKTRVDALTVFDLDTAEFVSRNKRAQTKAPGWQYNFGLTLRVNEKLRGRFEIEGRDKSFFGYYHNGQLDSYMLAHASVSYKLGELTLQAWVRNLFNEDYQIHGLYFANDPRDAFAVNRSYYQFGEPRVYGLNASYHF